MKKLLTIAAASIAVLLLVVMPVASQAPHAEKTFSGTLTKVDAAKRVISDLPSPPAKGPPCPHK